MPVPPMSIPRTCCATTLSLPLARLPEGNSPRSARADDVAPCNHLGIADPGGSLSRSTGCRQGGGPVRPAEPRKTERTQMPGYRELLAQTKKNIHEVTPAEAEERLGDATFLDVRELDEYEQGTVPDSVFIPRGHLESQVENKVSKDKPVVVYCAAGNRSAFAAETLRELGYEDVASLKGGFGRWK